MRTFQATALPSVLAALLLLSGCASAPVDHSKMDHSKMDHGKMNHGTMLNR